MSVAPFLTGGSGFLDRRPNMKRPPMTGALTVEARAHASTDPAALWALLENVDRYKDWGPWSESGYVKQPSMSPHGAGAIRRLRYRNRRAVTIEPVAERLLVYEVTSGIPVRNYRATVRLTPDDRGTAIHWRATFDRTLGGRLVRRTSQSIYREIVDQLVSAAETTVGLATPSTIDRHPSRHWIQKEPQ